MISAWKIMKGACLLLLGLMAIGSSRSNAADISTSKFAKFAADSSTEGGTTTKSVEKVSPFMPETTTSNQASQVTQAAYTSDSNCGTSDIDCYVGAPGNFWFRGEYIRWWTKGPHLPPLVSTVNDLNDPTGSLETVYGDRSVENGSHEGYRVNLGMWLNCCHTWGIEGDYFDISQNNDNYDSGNTNGYDSNGNVFPIVRPFFDYETQQVSLDAVGYPANYYGRVTVQTSDYFQSAGVWLRHQLHAKEWSTNNKDICWTDDCARTLRVDAIAGYRYSRLIDHVNIHDEEININSADTNFLTNYTFGDNYTGSNQFHGADIGLDTVFTRGCWSLDILTKVGLGNNRQTVTLDGLAIVDSSTRGGTIQTFAGKQIYTRDNFSAIPELTATVGYQVTDHFKLSAGYDMLYWSNVVRAADHIAVEPRSGLPFGTASIPAVLPPPPFVFNESFYWAQGVKVGGEFRF